jgi:UDP-N-acetylglucosamine 2-epimerase
LPVILFHAGFEWFSGGFVGLDVFFVISGYLITTINIGDRQKGRMQSDSVINCNPISADIKDAIKKSYTDQFKNLLLIVENPYGDVGAAKRIINSLSRVDMESLIHKEFYDLDLK